MSRFLFLSFLLLPFLCSSQNYGLCRQVIASTGGSGVQANYRVSWTVGELVVSTVVGVDRKLTQGFHQPDVCAPVSTSNPDLELLGIEVFPNPTTDFLTIRYSDFESPSLQVVAFDMLGHLVLQPKALDTPESTIIDATNWPAGVYFLKIQDSSSPATATVRVVRL